MLDVVCWLYDEKPAFIHTDVSRFPMLTFHESYGYLPKSTLRLIKKYSVSPNDYAMLLEKFGYVYTPFPS